MVRLALSNLPLSAPAVLPPREPPGSPPPAEHEQRRLRALQARVFALTWLAYASYYFTRKNLSVVKSRLHDDLGLSTAELGSIDTVYLLCYAAGQFASGALGDRLGARRLITLGMLGSAVMAGLFGASSTVVLFGLAFGVNGFFQSTGWPGNVKAMQPFFPRALRGRVMGVWTTNYQAGGLAATALATYLLVHFGWRATFFGPALWVLGVALLVWLLLVERPQDAGLPPFPEEATLGQPSPSTVGVGVGVGVGSAPRASAGPSLAELLRMPLLWTIGGAYFGLKLIRYSLLFWLPFYLKQHLHYTEGQAGYLSMPFEIGGIVGSVVVGWLSDRYFSRRRLRLTAPVIWLLGAALLAYQALGGGGLVLNAALLALVGFLLFGPDSLISGAVSQDIGGAQATGRVAGIINGMGSVGATLSPLLVAAVSKTFGWNGLFYGFVAVTCTAGALLLLASVMHTRRTEAH